VGWRDGRREEEGRWGRASEEGFKKVGVERREQGRIGRWKGRGRKRRKGWRREELGNGGGWREAGGRG
jgi:hypothetical protein